MTDNTVTVKKNVTMQTQILEQLGENQPFSPKGIKYLANRALGTKYKKPLFAALALMKENTLQSSIPVEIKELIKMAFAYTHEVPDAALIIIGTGRRAVHGEKGWSEGGESLLKVDHFPPGAENFPEAEREKLIKKITRQDNQMEACTALMQFFFEQAIEEAVVAPPPKKATAKKTASVVSLHKEPKVIPITDATAVTPDELAAVQTALEPIPEPVVAPEPIVKKVAKKTKTAKKPAATPAKQDVDG